MNVKNKTIFCKDNIEILRGMNSTGVDLIYLDPPFNKNKKFTAPTGSSAEGAAFEDIFREKDIKDEWLENIKSDDPVLHEYLQAIKKISDLSDDKTYLYNYCYLVYMAIRLLECHRILKDTGSIYFHCDQTMSHYIKILMDIIFGEKNFRNEIVWHYGKWSNATQNFQKNHDCIFFYSKTNRYTFNPIYYPRNKNRDYHTNIVQGKGQLLVYEPQNAPAQIIEKYKTKGYKIVYLKEKGVLEHDVWTYLRQKNFNILNSQSKERVGYPTQKPMALLERIIKASTNKGDLVLDPFCGCATTCVAAEKLNRQWIGIDVSDMACEVIKSRFDKSPLEKIEFIFYAK